MANGKEEAQAIRDCLISPNESDSNMESANVVDGLFAIARAINRLATVLGAMPLRDLIDAINVDGGTRE